MSKTWASFQNISDNQLPSRELGHSLANKTRLNTCVKKQKDRNTWSKHLYRETEILGWSTSMERQNYLVEVLPWRGRYTWLKYFYGATKILGWNTSMEWQKYLVEEFNGERQAIKGRVWKVHTWHDHHLTVIIFGEAGMESVPLSTLLEPRTLALLVTSDPTLGPAISWIK